MKKAILTTGLLMMLFLTSFKGPIDGRGPQVPKDANVLGYEIGGGTGSGGQQVPKDPNPLGYDIGGGNGGGGQQVPKDPNPLG